jgi:hypothetical protein
LSRGTGILTEEDSGGIDIKSGDLKLVGREEATLDTHTHYGSCTAFHLMVEQLMSGLITQKHKLELPELSFLNEKAKR